MSPSGRPYLVFTAGTTQSPHARARLYRVPLGKKAPGGALSIAGKPQLVLSHGSAEPSPVPWCATDCFDADYSGGGTLLQCPDNGPLLMAYHGENHTNPLHQFVVRQGWSGIGLARWDPRTRRFVKIDQIIGLNANNRWRHTAAGWETWQAPALAFQADMVRNPANGMVYLYYGDKLPGSDPYKGGRIALAAISTNTLCSNAASGIHSDWRKWFHGSFSQPGVYTTAHNQARPAGTGGTFTPILDGGGETSPNVIYRHGTWYMVTARGHAGINLRTSADGIHWSPPKEV